MHYELTHTAKSVCFELHSSLPTGLVPVVSYQSLASASTC